MSNLRELIMKQMERARNDLYQAVHRVHTTNNRGFSESYVLNKSRKLDTLIYRFLLSEKKGDIESERKGREP